MLCRVGNKQAISDTIQRCFPPHTIYIEPFFGAGGMFFNKPRVAYNIVNDLDSDVHNLFQVLLNQKKQFLELFTIMPVHSDLLEHWKKHTETEPLKKALRFVFLSNYTLYGRCETMRLGIGNSKEQFLKGIDRINDALRNVKFSNKDFRAFLQSISLNLEEIPQAFCYADPPYLGTDPRYKHTYTSKDSECLFNALQSKKIKWAMSEFDNPFILEQAERQSLNIIYIGERRNLKNRRTEILITNYTDKQLKLF